MCCTPSASVVIENGAGGPAAAGAAYANVAASTARTRPDLVIGSPCRSDRPGLLLRVTYAVKRLVRTAHGRSLRAVRRHRTCGPQARRGRAAARDLLAPGSGKVRGAHL